MSGVAVTVIVVPSSTVPSVETATVPFSTVPTETSYVVTLGGIKVNVAVTTASSVTSNVVPVIADPFTRISSSLYPESGDAVTVTVVPSSTSPAGDTVTVPFVTVPTETSYLSGTTL